MTEQSEIPSKLSLNENLDAIKNSSGLSDQEFKQMLEAYLKESNIPIVDKDQLEFNFDHNNNWKEPTEWQLRDTLMSIDDVSSDVFDIQNEELLEETLELIKNEGGYFRLDKFDNKEWLQNDFNIIAKILRQKVIAYTLTASWDNPDYYNYFPTPNSIKMINLDKDSFNNLLKKFPKVNKLTLDTVKGSIRDDTHNILNEIAQIWDTQLTTIKIDIGNIWNHGWNNPFPDDFRKRVAENKILVWGSEVSYLEEILKSQSHKTKLKYETIESWSWFMLSKIDY